ncbi:MAG TPA: hypothetical protein VHT04_04155, partial [Stellaceae bacterium]|nr:hypothetical protein [Stellaceae bacterium]
HSHLLSKTPSPGAAMINPEAVPLAAVPDAAGDVAEPSLGRAERTLIYGLRRMASGDDGCAATRRDFADIAGPLAEDALAAFRCFFWTLATFGRRRVALGFPGAGTVSLDERLLIAVFAAAGHRLMLPTPVRPARPPRVQLALISFCRLRSPSGRG